MARLPTAPCSLGPRLPCALPRLLRRVERGERGCSSSAQRPEVCKTRKRRTSAWAAVTNLQCAAHRGQCRSREGCRPWATACSGPRPLVRPPPAARTHAPACHAPHHRRRLQRRLRRAKRAARSELSISKGGWVKHGYAAAQPPLTSTAGVVDTLPRVDGRSLSQHEFDERFEKPRVPCVLEGLLEGWPAARGWTPDRLLQRCGSHRFKVGGGPPRGGATGGGPSPLQCRALCDEPCSVLPCPV